MRRTCIFARRTMTQLRRDPLAVFFAVVVPFLMTLVFGFVGHYAEGARATFSGAALWSAATVIGLTLPVVPLSAQIAQDRACGFFSDAFFSPLRRREMIAGYVLTGLVGSLCVVLAVTTAAEILGIFAGAYIPLAAVARAMVLWLPSALSCVLCAVLIGLLSTPRFAPLPCAALFAFALALSGVILPLDGGGALLAILRRLPPWPAVALGRAAAFDRSCLADLITSAAYPPALLCLLVFLRRGETPYPRRR